MSFHLVPFIWFHLFGSICQVDIMGIHSRKMNVLRGIDLKSIAEKMTAASGSMFLTRSLSHVFFIKNT